MTGKTADAVKTKSVFNALCNSLDDMGRSCSKGAAALLEKNRLTGEEKREIFEKR